jgi:D-alanyl-D-alanine carboxypeptidase
MVKVKLWDRLAQPRSLAAVLAVIVAFVAISAIPADARRYYYRHYYHHRHAYHHHFAHHRGHRVYHPRYARHRIDHARASYGDGGIIGDHRGFAAIVVDGASGRTLFARNEHELRHPASVTKVMTLYLLFEQLERGRLRLNSPLMISAHAAAQAPSKLGLDPGETIDVQNAIKAVVTKSANDVAAAIAENIAGDEQTFAQMMTRKAHALGMRHTHYENASGLPNSEQVTTAHDLAILGRAIQDRFPRYYRYFSTHSFAYNGALHRNHNHLLGRVEGMDGIKTGYTRASGFNLLTSVRRHGHHIVAVVLGGRTAGTRDRVMAGLIEENIDGGAPIRTARAITDDAAPEGDERVAERAPERVVERVAVAERDDFSEEEDIVPEPRPIHRAAAAPVALLTPPAPIPTRERAEKAEKVRPAFVPGVQKRMAEEPMDRKGRAKDRERSIASTDGSTSSGRAARREITATTTTPSSLRNADANRTQIARADASRPSRPGWMIQIGATEDADKANQLLSRARSQMQGFPATAKAFTEKVQKGNETLWRARFAGLEEQSAESACKALKRSGFSCFTTKN